MYLGINGHFHCVLVIIDSFTKSVKVVPLPRHDAASVAWVFISVRTWRGPPKSAAATNSELNFANAIMSAMFDAFSVRVKHGAVKDPQ